MVRVSISKQGFAVCIGLTPFVDELGADFRLVEIAAMRITDRFHGISSSRIYSHLQNFASQTFVPSNIRIVKYSFANLCLHSFVRKSQIVRQPSPTVTVRLQSTVTGSLQPTVTARHCLFAACHHRSSPPHVPSLPARLLPTFTARLLSTFTARLLPACLLPVTARLQPVISSSLPSPLVTVRLLPSSGYRHDYDGWV